MNEPFEPHALYAPDEQRMVEATNADHAARLRAEGYTVDPPHAHWYPHLVPVVDAPSVAEPDPAPADEKKAKKAKKDPSA